MEYKEFLTAFRKELEAQLGGHVHTETVRVCKNNIGRKEGLAVMGEDSTAVPVIYPEEFYKLHQEGDDVGSVAEKAAYILRQEQEKGDVLDGFRKNILDWESAKERLMPVLIHAEWNREALEEAASVPFLDLAVCFQLQAARPGGGLFSCRISKRQMASWGISEDELMRQGMQNLERAGHRITGWEELMKEFFGAEYSGEGEEEPMEEGDFAVLTTPERTYGASGILRKGLLADYADKVGKNLFLIPSSVHEFIILPDNGNADLEELRNMIKTVNARQVAREEQLSDHAYYYDREKGEVRLSP